MQVTIMKTAGLGYLNLSLVLRSWRIDWSIEFKGARMEFDGIFVVLDLSYLSQALALFISSEFDGPGCSLMDLQYFWFS